MSICDNCLYKGECAYESRFKDKCPLFTPIGDMNV